MIRQKFLILFILLQCSYSFSQDDWKLVRDSDAIKIHTKKEGTNKFETFKASVTINSSIHNFMAVFNDMDLFPQWGYKVKSAKLLEKSGDTLQIYYTIASAPFPYKNRDGIYLTRSNWYANTKTLHVDIKVLDEYLPLNDKYVRIKGYGYWDIKVINDTKLDVTFSMQIIPGGSIPSWLANLFVDDAPYNTLLNLREMMESKDYVKYKFDFID